MTYDPNNVSKYYYCRDRFVQSFISIGHKAGQSIPFSARYYKNAVHELRAGETTLALGSYIAFLATEYRLFTDSNLDTAQTVEELYHALETVNRLDYNAETFSVIPNSNPPEKYPPQLSGYLVRTDIDNDTFLKDNPNIALGFPNEGYSMASGYIYNSGQTLPVNRLRPSQPKPVSRDHIFRILWGLLLTTKLLDDVRFGQSKFRDGISDFKEECRAIHTRIRNFIASKGGKIIMPDGTVPIGGNMMGDMWTINKSLKNINHGPRKSWLPQPWSGFLFTGWMNGRMSIEKQNISGNWYRAWERSWKYGYESYFLYYGKLVYGWPLGSWLTNTSKRKLRLKSTTEFYLNVFPGKGNFKHTDSEYSPFGWAMPDRSERSISDGYFGMHATGNFNALDFLLMHNLYYLNHFDELGKLPKNTGQEPAENISYIDKNVMKAELERVQSFLDRQSASDFFRFYIQTLGRGFRKYNSQPQNSLSTFLRKVRWVFISFSSSYNKLTKQRKEYRKRLEEMGKVWP